MNCTKIILSSYNNLNKMIQAIEDEIDDKCVFSYGNKMPCAEIVEDIAGMINRKERFKLLKWKIDKVFSFLNDEEIDLLNCKYLNKPPKHKFDFSLRTYFRKQVRLLKKIDEYFSYIGLSDETFFDEFKNDRFITSAAIKAEDIKRLKCLYFENAGEIRKCVKKSA